VTGWEHQYSSGGKQRRYILDLTEEFYSPFETVTVGQLAQSKRLGPIARDDEFPLRKSGMNQHKRANQSIDLFPWHQPSNKYDVAGQACGYGRTCAQYVGREADDLALSDSARLNL
jgi:hypothetical protein